MKIKWKAGVKPRDNHLIMRWERIQVANIYKKHGKELVITCTGGGSHSITSLHPDGYAFDCRTYYFSSNEKKKVFEEIKEVFRGTKYQVVFESDHFHIEFDIGEE